MPTMAARWMPTTLASKPPMISMCATPVWIVFEMPTDSFSHIAIVF